MKNNLLKSLWVLAAAAFLLPSYLFANLSDTLSGKPKEYDASGTTMHHLLDSYALEFYKKSNGEYATIELPRILWNSAEGKLDFFLNTHSAIEAGYIDAHLYNHDAKHGVLLIPQGKDQLEEALKVQNSATSSLEKEDALQNLHQYVTSFTPIDLSITKNVLFIFIACGLLIFVFVTIASAYKKNTEVAPKGMQSFFEPIIIFIRDDIARPNLHRHYERFMPFLLTVFFFIWFLNLLGLIPFSGNVTGNISVTCSLALITFFITTLNGNKTYWGHIFWMPGTPLALKPLMMIVEIIGVFAKPFALMIRLFANITAGHVIILAFIGLIFVIGKMGENQIAAWGTSIFSTAFILFIYALELFVAILQAYVFTVLSAIYIGTALEESH